MLPALSESAANHVYLFGWILLIVSCVAALLSAAALFWGDKVREIYAERRMTRSEERISKAHKDTAGAKERIAELEKETAKAHERTAELEKETVEAKLALTEVALETGPRSIKFLRSNFNKLLSEIPTGSAEVIYKPDDSEAYGFACAINLALHHAHWKVVNARPIPPDPIAFGLQEYAIAPPPERGGLTIKLRSLGGETREHPGRKLTEVFLKSGFSCISMADSSLDKDKVVIVVGQSSPMVITFGPPTK